MTKLGVDLANFAISCLGHPYMYGVNGQAITEALIQQKARQYPYQYTPEKIKILRSKIGQVAYQCNSFLSLFMGVEKTANGWLASASRCGSISSIPETRGVSVHYNDHTGIYIGDGWVVEARGTSYGVVKTRLDARPWKEWAMHYGIAYSTQGDGFMIRKGDKGSVVYDLQKAMLAAGYNLGAFKDMETGEPNGCDGDFGSATEKAVKNLQAKHNINGTGAVDETTYGKLAKEIRSNSGNLLGELKKANAKIASARQALS